MLYTSLFSNPVWLYLVVPYPRVLLTFLSLRRCSRYFEPTLVSFTKTRRPMRIITWSNAKLAHRIQEYT